MEFEIKEHNKITYFCIIKERYNLMNSNKKTNELEG